MKNSLFLVCLVLCFMTSGVGLAQNQYYFNEGDTIYGRDTTYFYQWWSDQWLASDSMHKTYLNGFSTGSDGFGLHGRVVQYNYTEQPLNIVGIATSYHSICMSGMYASEHGIPWMVPLDIPTEQQEYVLLYEADTSRFKFYEVGRIPIDMSKPARYINIDYRYNGNYCCNIAPNLNKTIKIREFYFDKPVTVRDSFYVGHTLNGNYWPDPEWIGEDWPFRVTCWSLNIGFDRHNCPTDQMDCDTMPLQQFRFKQDDFMLFPNGIDSNIWYYLKAPSYTIEFPIIEIDSSFYDGPPQYVCPQVQNFRIAQVAENTVVFLWDTHGDHQYWQMSYGLAGTEPDDGTIVYCPMQVGQIMGMDSCTDYVAYVRAVCNHDSIVYSEWSAPLEFNICDTTGGCGTESIEGGLGQYIQLFPSPASDQVQVFSSFELRSIEVYDLQGRTVLNVPCEGHSAAFDVENWPKGMYVALVRTSAGNFTKKLVVH